MFKQVMMAALLAGTAMVPALAETGSVQVESVKDLTLERVFASPSLSGETPRAVRLSPDGKLLTMLRPRADDRERFDLWAMDTVTGEWRMLLDSLKIGSGGEISEAEKMQRERARTGGIRGIISYSWSPDGQSILVPLDGELFIAGLDGKVEKLTASKGGELNAAVSPSGKFVSYVRGQNFYVVDRSTGTETQLTDDGSDTLSWGLAEFVSQEEIGRSKGAWWAPDDSKIALARVDEAQVQIVSRAAIGASGTRVYDQRYPAAGTPNAIVELYILSADGTDRTKVDLGDDADIYLARVDWAPDGKSLIVQRQSRDQKQLDLLRVDAQTGASSVMFSETSPTWVNLHDNLRMLKDGGLLWWSEKSGHGHLYHIKDGKWTQLTNGDWEVDNVVAVDEAKGLVYFTGNRETPVEKQLYRASLRKAGPVLQLTESGWNNGAVMDGKATRAIISRSNTDNPLQSYIADQNGKRIGWISENGVSGDHPYAPFKASHNKVQFGTIKADDGTILHYNMILPKMEPGKKYPVWMQHYGGPGVQTVTNSWMGGLPQFIADQGYIYFQVDNRGATARGKAFEDHLYHAMGTVEVADQLKGVEYLKSLPMVAADRIVTFGWSYGGYMTLKLLEDAPGVFAAGVAGAPVTDWALYDTHYTERYLGDPRKVPEVYTKSGALENSAKIVDPLLVIHGLSDDNVVFDNSSRLIAKMQADGQIFDMALYPGKTHRVSGVEEQMYRTILNFFNRHIENKE